MSSRGPVDRTLHALKFLFVGPLVLVLLFFINLFTSPGHWWVQWAALGIGIAWVVSFFRVLKAALLVGGLAAVWSIYKKGQEASQPPPGQGTSGPASTPDRPGL
jgi:hypothetical protein